LERWSSTRARRRPRRPRLRLIVAARLTVAAQLAAAARLAAAALLALALLLGWGTGRTTSSDPAAIPSARTAFTARPAHRLRSAAGPVSARQALALAGEHVIFAYAGETPPASLIAAIRAGEVAGVILFAPNVASPAALAAAIGRMQAAEQASPEPSRLLFMTDQEGGLVRRLPGAPTLSQKQVGAGPDAATLARRAGAQAGANLAAHEINVNLAPVLDVFRSPGDFIDQFGRSYSDRAAVVSRLGADFITAQQNAGVAATAKHFPGLGSALRAQDTDVVPVRLPLSLATLRSTDESPYRLAIAAGVKLIMVSWATYPALDAARPAGLSSRVIVGELRRRLHFRGVTITDGIDAGALARFGTVARRSVLATQAGADLILACAAGSAENSPQIGLNAVRAIAHAVTAGRVGAAQLQASTARVLALRSWLARPQP
jgi:beta-N-acetylhexosaminidase